MKNTVGKTALITGANVGLGYETALALAGKGMNVIMACRNLQKASAARQQILIQYPASTVHVMEIDTSSLASVRNFATEYSMKYKKLDVLVNNAGIMMPPYQLSEDGFENQLATNYLGHFALTGLLLPHLLRTEGSRVVTLSSVAHRWSGIQFEDMHFEKGYNKRKAYGQSKLACLMFAYELDRKLKTGGHRTVSVAAHPGASDTNLAQHLPVFLKWLSPVVGQSPEAGAQPTLYAALSPVIKGGEYVGPDGFREFKGKPVLVDSSELSKDERVAKALWERSVELTGIRYDFAGATV